MNFVYFATHSFLESECTIYVDPNLFSKGSHFNWYCQRHTFINQLKKIHIAVVYT